jgi:hypothetical protein
VIPSGTLVSAAIAAWGYLIAPVPPPDPAPRPSPDAGAEVAQEAAAAPSPPAGAGEEPAVDEALGGTSPGSPLGSGPPRSAEIITPLSLGKRKNKKRDNQNGPGPGGEETGRFGTVEIKGRVFVLGEWQRGEVTVVDSSGALATAERDAFDISVASVRPLFRWQAPQKWLSGVIEFELTQKPDMRDGYVQARKKDLLLRAGQFKMPGSAIEMASPWVLPFVRRGFLHGLLVDELDNAWRRPGVMLRWRSEEFLRPEISAGVFQGVVVVSEGLVRDKDPIVAQSLSAQSLIGRAQIEPVLGLAIGAYYNYRVGTPAILRTARYWTAGADLVVDRTFASGGLRIWLDGIAGASWFEHPSKPADGRDTTFVAGRSILAWRFGGVEAEQRYLEAYGTFGVLEPDTQVVADLAVEGAVGFNLGLWQRLRITAQGEVWRVGRNFPPGYTLGIDPNRVAALLQVGVNL